MAMTKAAKLAMIRQWLADYDQIQHRGRDDAIGWIALKLSCSRRTAEKLIQEAIK